jgi:hypothetical protein
MVFTSFNNFELNNKRFVFWDWDFKLSQNKFFNSTQEKKNQSDFFDWFKNWFILHLYDELAFYKIQVNIA